MGLFEKIFPKTAVNQVTDSYFKTLNAYSPSFSSFSGGIYEAEMCRKCIHTFATHVSRLHIDTFGETGDRLDAIFKYSPNPWQSLSQLLYKLATVYETMNTAFIIPLLDLTGEHIEGIYAANPLNCVLREYKNNAYLKMTFPSGTAVVELSKVGILTKYQLNEDIIGGTDNTLRRTLEMIEIINQGIQEGVKSSASVRFLAKIASVVKDKDLKKLRNDFVRDNLSAENNNGMMLYDNKIQEVKQIDSKPLTVDAEQLKIIQNTVYSHFNINEKILMNQYTEEDWNAYYSGKIEPFAVQLSGVLQKMFLTENEILSESGIIASDNRLDHATNSAKTTMVTQLFDRGMMSRNEGRRIFGLEAVEDGDKFYIRKEYAESDKLDTMGE